MKLAEISITACIVLPFILIGCSTNTNDSTGSIDATKLSATERSFKLGVVPMPQDWSEEKIAAAYQLSTQTGEVVSLSQKLGWISDTYIRRYENDVALAREHALEIFISIDVLEDDRNEIANLPDELQGKGFADATLRQYYIDEVTEIAHRYRPDNLALAIEINGYHLSHPEDFSNYVSLYKQTFRSVKAVSPGTKVAVSFQYETLVGEGQWDLLGMFGDQLELLCLTTYPEILYGDSLSDLPENHYSILKNIGTLPIVFMEIGWSGNDCNDGEQQQAEFVKRFFDLTADINLSLGIWALLHDWQGGGSFETMGLIDANGRKKRAWEVVRAIRDLPFKE